MTYTSYAPGYTCMCPDVENSVCVHNNIIHVSCTDSANFTLLVASGNGVYSTAINGSSVSQIGGQSSVESNGRLYH